MKRALWIGLIIMMTPSYLTLMLVVHELGHTLLARQLGDPEARFYLWQSGPGGDWCLGCNIYDEASFAPGPAILTNLGGVLATQAVVMLALLLFGWVRAADWRGRFLAVTIWAYAIDPPFQVAQGLLYDIERHRWPSGVDMVDVMLLVSRETGAPQELMKAGLVAGTVVYLGLLAVVYMMRRVREPVAVPVEAVVAQADPAGSGEES